MMILFSKKNNQTDKIFNWKNFFNFSEINEQFYQDLEESLILSDIGGKNTLEIINFLKDKIEAEKIKEIEIAKNILKEYLNRSLLNKKVEFSQDKLKVIIIVGINGVGKTTTIGKLIYFFQEKKITVGAGDTYRAAAKEQLKVWTDRFKVRLISQQAGSDAASVAYDTIHSALNNKDELAIIDTAGRLHNKENLS